MLFLIVGPSGAGKDTLLALARQRLAGKGFRFARRAITRPADVGDEGHLAVERADFERVRHAGGYALWWEAHGLLYGIPVDIENDLRAGRNVVASVSRAVLEFADSRYCVRILEVFAPPEILAGRLAGRAREGVSDIAARLARVVPLPEHLRVTRVLNDDSVELGAARMIAALDPG